MTRINHFASAALLTLWHVFTIFHYWDNPSGLSGTCVTSNGNNPKVALRGKGGSFGVIYFQVRNTVFYKGNTNRLTLNGNNVVFHAHLGNTGCTHQMTCGKAAAGTQGKPSTELLEQQPRQSAVHSCNHHPAIPLLQRSLPRSSLHQQPRSPAVGLSVCL